MKNLVIPYLTLLVERGFEIGENQTSICSLQFKIVTFKLIAKALESGKPDLEYFSSLKLAELMIEELSSSEDKNVL